MSIKEKSKELFSDKIWTINLEGLSNAKRRLVRFIKLFRIIIGTFAANRVGFQCVSLSYFCSIALVPLLAIVFAVTGGLGLSDKVAELLRSIIPSYPEIVDLLVEKSENIISTASNGAAGAISAAFFIWGIVWMLFQIERVFNNVWGIRKIPRKMYKRFSFYLITLILIPFIVLIFCFGIAAYTDMLSSIGIDWGELSFMPTLLGWLAFYLVTVFTLSAMYKFIPATFVRYSCALKSAWIAAAVFALFQYVYLETQVFVTRINAVYGVIAAVPLFLMWLNWSWQIIMYGAELSYGLQNIDSYNIPEDMTIADFSKSVREKNHRRDDVHEGRQ